jgi:hypothetical protein
VTATPITTELTLLRTRVGRLLSGTGSLQDLGSLIDGLRGLAARLHGTSAVTGAELEDFAAGLGRARDLGVVRIADLQRLADRLAVLAAGDTGA